MVTRLNLTITLLALLNQQLQLHQHQLHIKLEGHKCTISYTGFNRSGQGWINSRICSNTWSHMASAMLVTIQFWGIDTRQISSWLALNKHQSFSIILLKFTLASWLYIGLLRLKKKRIYQVTYSFKNWGRLTAEMGEFRWWTGYISRLKWKLTCLSFGLVDVRLGIEMTNRMGEFGYLNRSWNGCWSGLKRV